jgi:5,10-methylenetetrahydromethanopterin reductase
MKFGFGAVPAHSIKDSVELAQLGERLGFDMAWMPDQTFYRDPFVVMTVIAQETERIRLMLGVTNPYTRHPAQVARAMATLDEVSNGRAVVGYGAGNRKELLLPLGYEQDLAGQRCREAVVVVKRLLAGEKVEFRSSTLVAEGVELLIPPRPALPVYLAGRGPKIFEAAGEVADGVVIGGLVSARGLKYALDVIAQGETRRDSGLAPLHKISWVSCHITADRAETIERLKSNVAHIIGGAPRGVLLTIGLESERIDHLKKAYAAGGPAGAAPLIKETEVDMLTIVGDGKACSARIQQLADAGIDELGVLLTQKTPKDQVAFLRQFAAEVMPYFR